MLTDSDFSGGGTGLTLFPLDGGEARRVANSPGVGFPRYPFLLPDGETLVYNFAARGDVFAFKQMYLQRGLDPNVKPELIADVPNESFHTPAYLEDAGVLLLDGLRAGIWAVPLDADYRPMGSPELILADAGGISSSAGGTVVYHVGEGARAELMGWVDRAGAVIESFPHGQVDLREVTLSPDGTRVAFRSPRGRGMRFDLWVRDLERGSETVITAEPAQARSQDLLDNQTLVYNTAVTSADNSIVIKLANGLGEPRAVVGSGRFRLPATSGTGDAIVFIQDGQDTGEDIFYVGAEGDTPLPYLATASSESRAQLSPDGERLLYVSDATGSSELWVSTFPEPGEPVRISVAGAGFFRWSPRGDEIFFDDTGTTGIEGSSGASATATLWAVAVDRSVPLSISK